MHGDETVWGGISAEGRVCVREGRRRQRSIIMHEGWDRSFLVGRDIEASWDVDACLEGQEVDGRQTGAERWQKVAAGSSCADEMYLVERVTTINKFSYVRRRIAITRHAFQCPCGNLVTSTSTLATIADADHNHLHSVDDDINDFRLGEGSSLGNTTHSRAQMLSTTEDASLMELEYETGTESSEDLPQTSGEPLPSMNRPELDSRMTRDLEDETSSNHAWKPSYGRRPRKKPALYIALGLLPPLAHPRPRRRSPHLPHDPSPKDVDRQNAHTELQRMEIFFLILARFSTALFLLATGIRPWTHVVERLTHRISHLHYVIHYPGPEQTTEDLRQQLTDLKEHMEKMEHTLEKVLRRMDDGAEAMYEYYVDEAVDVVEKSMWRHEKKCEKQDQRVKDVEISVDSLRKVRGRYLDVNANPSLLLYVPPAWLVSPPPHASVVKYPPPLSLLFSTASSSFGPSEHLPMIPENGRLNLRKPAPEPPTGLGARLLYGTVSLVTLSIRVAVAVVDRTVEKKLLFSFVIYSAIHPRRMCRL
ncbi:hypothetical protein IW262DRAFT_1462694 [Armillaria fumosa]|nr:hypothetical protein IW262DRAFT_1462694 [Armillaria fumosa]